MHADLEYRQGLARRGLRALSNIVGDMPGTASISVNDMSALLSLMSNVIEDAIPDRDVKYGMGANDEEDD